MMMLITRSVRRTAEEEVCRKDGAAWRLFIGQNPVGYGCYRLGPAWVCLFSAWWACTVLQYVSHAPTDSGSTGKT
jgi:hypothetical protein